LWVETTDLLKNHLNNYTLEDVKRKYPAVSS
jgi:hypothetical protein